MAWLESDVRVGFRRFLLAMLSLRRMGFAVGDHLLLLLKAWLEIGGRDRRLRSNNRMRKKRNRRLVATDQVNA